MLEGSTKTSSKDLTIFKQISIFSAGLFPLVYPFQTWRHSLFLNYKKLIFVKLCWRPFSCKLWCYLFLFVSFHYIELHLQSNPNIFEPRRETKIGLNLTV